MSRPFATALGEHIIWEVGNNRHQSLHSMNSGKLKDIVQRCWNSEAELRPSFKELLCTLEHNVSTAHIMVYVYIGVGGGRRV